MMDFNIIILNKKAGMVVHPAPGNQDNTLVNALLHYTNNNLSSLLSNNMCVVGRQIHNGIKLNSEKMGKNYFEIR